MILKVFENILPTIFSLIIIYIFNKLFVLLMKRISTNMFLFVNDKDKVDSGRFNLILIPCNINGELKRNYSTVKFDHVDLTNNLINIRCIRHDDEVGNKSPNLLFNVNDEIPLLFKLKIIYNYFIYRITPKSNRCGEWKMLLSKKMENIINNKLEEIGKIKYNLEHYCD